MTVNDNGAALLFVDTNEVDDTYRCCLWAAPGQGKSVAAASAPSPILVLSADRPSAYKFARKHHANKDIREVRYRDASTLDSVYQYLSGPDGAEIRTLVIDPVSSIYDQLVDTAPTRSDGDADYQRVNKKLLGFVQSLRRFDINVILVAHEKLNDGKKGDGKLYPALGGPALINKLLAEMDLVAHIERHVRVTEAGEEIRWVGQLQPRDNLVCKESTGALGDRRIADLSRWFELASASFEITSQAQTGSVEAEQPAAETPVGIAAASRPEPRDEGTTSEDAAADGREAATPAPEPGTIDLLDADTQNRLAELIARAHEEAGWNDKRTVMALGAYGALDTSSVESAIATLPAAKVAEFETWVKESVNDAIDARLAAETEATTK